MPTPGDIVIVDFPGTAATKRRPAVVRSSAPYHAARPDVVIGVITSNVAQATAPTDRALQDWAAANLRVASAFRSYLVTLPANQVGRRVGALSATDWQAVQKCVRLALGL